MMLLIGPRKKTLQQGLNKGFTLIELLIVCAIILALVSFSTPLFRKQFTDLELKEVASNISKFITFAQQKAVIDRTIYKISFDFENKKYQLLMASGEGQDVKYNNPKDRFGRIFTVPNSIDIKGEVQEILFYPDGHSDKVELILTNTNGKGLKIATTGTMANVIITEEKE